MTAGKILVVEDESPVRHLICAMLSQYGYETLEAGDGEEALRIWASHGDGVVLVLTDLVMPRMGGAELARRMRKAMPAVKVVFMSGYAERTVHEGADEIGCGFLAKPFTVTSLTQVVRAALEHGEIEPDGNASA